MTAPIRIEDKYELYRIVTDMDALHEAFRDRIDDLNATRTSVDDAGGFTPGYSAKILCHPPMKAIGRDSLPKILKATGMALVLVIDDKQFSVVKDKLIKRRRPIRAVARIKRVKGFFTTENAGKINKKRWAKISPELRSKIMRRVINARWRAERRRSALAALESRAPRSTQSILLHASPIDAI